MKHAIIFGILAAISPQAALAQAKNKPYVFDKKSGVYLFKAKHKNWKVTAGEGYFQGSLAKSYDRTTDVAISFIAVTQKGRLTTKQLGEMAANQNKAYNKDGNTSKVKVSRKSKWVGNKKLASDGHYVEILRKMKSGGEHLIRQWYLVDKQNPLNVLLITIEGSAENYKKAKRYVGYVLARIISQRVK